MLDLKEEARRCRAFSDFADIANSGGAPLWHCFFLRRLRSTGLRAQKLPNAAVYMRSFVSRGFNHARPFLALSIEFPLVQQIRSLDDGFYRIAQVMSKFAQLSTNLRIEFLGVLHLGTGRHAGLTASL